VPALDALSFLPERVLTGDEAHGVRHGVPVLAEQGAEEAPIRLTHEGELLAVAEPRGQDLRPVVVFAE
jgi:hypothetical protein